MTCRGPYVKRFEHFSKSKRYINAVFIFVYFKKCKKKYSGNKITTTTTTTATTTTTTTTTATTTTTTTTTITTTITAHFRLWWVRDLAPKVVIATG